MVNIKFNNNYKIKSDKYNFILYRRKDKTKRSKHIQNMTLDKNEDDKEVGWSIVGYYPDIDWLYHELIDLEIKLSDAKNFQEVINVLKELNSSLRHKETT